MSQIQSPDPDGFRFRRADHERAVDVLRELGVACEMTVASAHRSPARVQRLLAEAPGRGVQVFIVGRRRRRAPGRHRGGAHHASPSSACPIDSSPLQGLDALLSTVQMPPGVPVATVAVGKAGATNAGVLAAQMLALGDPALARVSMPTRRGSPKRWSRPRSGSRRTVARVRARVSSQKQPASRPLDF